MPAKFDHQFLVADSFLKISPYGEIFFSGSPQNPFGSKQQAGLAHGSTVIPANLQSGSCFISLPHLISLKSALFVRKEEKRGKNEVFPRIRAWLALHRAAQRHGALSRTSEKVS
jgi:hypothetical protein